MTLKANDSSEYIALSPIVVTSMDSSTIYLDLRFLTNIGYFGSLQLYVVFINPIAIR